MFGKAILIHNGSAGQAETGTRLGAVIGPLAAGIGELTLVQTKEPGDAERICWERGEETDLVLVLGGDGTVHECVNGLAALADPPVVGILPGGTCNDFSRALYIPQELDRAAETLMRGKTQTVDIGRANDRYFSNFFGIGLITDASVNINPQLKGMIGKLSYFISTLQTVTSADPFRFTLEHDSGQTGGEAVMLFVANGRFLGTRPLPLAPDALYDGVLDVAIIREAGLPLLKELFKIKNFEEWDSEKSSFEFIRTTSLKLTTDQPMQADMDGEIYVRTPAEISVLGKKLTFLVGEEQP
ncbi:YegS/Rv2252/BmrU family lipid kinase [Paenibacillus chitinolyticus]|uniref:diacylglycerol/lipid kinase family protein n=1 Tax=Paenibacillus chitinolyticus TaxID=79263 RepID=UPI002DBE4E38|nr:YegS/Rv2252/BmrU family lipid kinase [Paenibacillus chitinolyticus]MEC0245310.1 YegS/Rv2252/BmrU family lipid kinase [Paenibacillus chitinolyticus]